jgi:xanthine dehydrogenase small subunit
MRFDATSRPERERGTMPITVKTFASIGEAASALASDRGARFLAGGTLVMRAINEGDASLATIVRATDGSFAEIRPAGARITIGAGATMAQVLAHRELAFLHPAARAVGGPAVRNAATVGGNLFAPAPYGDFTVALLALDATLAVHGSYSGRELPLDEFLAGRDRHGGLVVSVTFNRPAGPEAFRFRKVARVKPKGISVLSIAAHLPVSGGRIAGARVAYGAMAPTPIRARAVERALEGKSLDEGGIAAALAAAAEGTSPASDAIASAWYRREMIAVHLKRLLLEEGR